MCIGVQAKIIRKEGKYALADFGGVKRKIRVDLTPEVKVGDIVMVHAGFSIGVVRDEMGGAQR